MSQKQLFAVGEAYSSSRVKLVKISAKKSFIYCNTFAIGGSRRAKRTTVPAGPAWMEIRCCKRAVNASERCCTFDVQRANEQNTAAKQLRPHQLCAHMFSPRSLALSFALRSLALSRVCGSVRHFCTRLLCSPRVRGRERERSLASRNFAWQQ